MQRYEYEFVRLEVETAWFTGYTLPSDEAKKSYPQVVHDYAHKGWRLVQIFTPGLSMEGMASYIELIFERPIS